MNTKEIGDILEVKTLEIIKKLVNEGRLGVLKEYVRIFTNKIYPSKIRNGGVEFDLTVEIWPPGANRYSMIYFIECKNYKNRVPISKIKKFYADITETSGLNAKAIFVSNAPLQKGAYEFAEAKEMMVIEGESSDNFKITLYKSNGSNNNRISIINDTFNREVLDEDVISLEKLVDKQILSALIESKSSSSYGIEFYSKDEIAAIAGLELDNFDESYIRNAYGLDTKRITDYLYKEYDLKIETFLPNKNNYLGICDIDNKTIGLSRSIINTPRELFVLCHEFGHFRLHQKLRINQELLNAFSDPIQNLEDGRKKLENPRHWIEWQANYFAASLLMPETSIKAKLWQHQQRLGYSKGNLILNDDYSNHHNYVKIINYLSNHFSVSKTSIIYRLREFDLIQNDSRTKSIGDLINDYKSNFFT